MNDPALTLDRIFHPKSVAIVGASENLIKMGARCVQSLIEIGFEGESNGFDSDWGIDQTRDTFIPKPKPKSKPGQAYLVDELVEHKKFGLGRIKEYLDLGEDSIIVVRFNSGKTKSLMVKYAKLTKLER